MIDVYLERLEHPYLFSLLPITVLLLALGFVAQTLGVNKVAGFLGLYAMVAIILWFMGYFAFYSLKYGGRTLRWWRMKRSPGY